MRFERVAPGDAPVDLDALGMRSKLGGSPTWIHEEETPECPSCERAMAFVAQIDSIEHDEEYNPHRVMDLARRHGSDFDAADSRKGGLPRK